MKAHSSIVNVKPEQKPNSTTNDEVYSVCPSIAKPLVIRRLICFFKLWGTSNYYEGIDKPTAWQWLYSWRLSAKTAWKVSGIIWSSNGA